MLEGIGGSGGIGPFDVIGPLDGIDDGGSSPPVGRGGETGALLMPPEWW